MDAVFDSPDDGECVFCRIVVGLEAADLVWTDDVAIAFLDCRPLFHGHTLVIPRRHRVTLADLALDEVGPFFERVRAISAVIPSALGCSGTFVANNNVVSQSVAHLHVHVVPRTKGDGLRGFFWPRTTYSGSEAADVASTIRSALEVGSRRVSRVVSTVDRFVAPIAARLIRRSHCICNDMRGCVGRRFASHMGVIRCVRRIERSRPNAGVNRQHVQSTKGFHHGNQGRNDRDRLQCSRPVEGRHRARARRVLRSRHRRDEEG